MIAKGGSTHLEFALIKRIAIVQFISRNHEEKILGATGMDRSYRKLLVKQK